MKLHHLLLTAVLATTPLCAHENDTWETIIARTEMTNYGDAYLKSIQKRLMKQLPAIRDGGDINAVLPEANGTTALHNACALADYDLVEFLLQHGADPTLRTAKGASVTDCIGKDKGGRINKLVNTYLKKPSARRKPGTDPAPASLAGRALELNYTSACTRGYRDGKWDEWEPAVAEIHVESTVFGADGCARSNGDDGHPGHSFIHRYARKDATTAILTVEYDDGTAYLTITLHFTGPEAGTAELRGTDAVEGFRWETRDITFRVR